MDALVCGEAKQRTKMKKIHQNSIRQYETGAKTEVPRPGPCPFLKRSKILFRSRIPDSAKLHQTICACPWPWAEGNSGMSASSDGQAANGHICAIRSDEIRDGQYHVFTEKSSEILTGRSSEMPSKCSKFNRQKWFQTRNQK